MRKGEGRTSGGHARVRRRGHPNSDRAVLVDGASVRAVRVREEGARASSAVARASSARAGDGPGGIRRRGGRVGAFVLGVEVVRQYFFITFNIINIIIILGTAVSFTTRKEREREIADLTRSCIKPKSKETMATEATDEGDEEAHALFHHTHPPGYGG